MSSILRTPGVSSFVFGFASGFMLALLVGFGYLLSVEKALFVAIEKLEAKIDRPLAGS